MGTALSGALAGGMSRNGSFSGAASTNLATAAGSGLRSFRLVSDLGNASIKSSESVGSAGSALRTSISGRVSGSGAAGSEGGATKPAPVTIQPTLLPQPNGVSFKLLRRMEADLDDAALTTGEVLTQLVLPETRQARCRYTDAILVEEQTKQVAPPHFFVAHSWSGNFSDMLNGIHSALSVRLPRINIDEAFFWIGECRCERGDGGSRALLLNW
eukprot:351676-Chlamydomonas_euryale.AAC.1